MSSLSLIVVLVALVQWSSGYSAHSRDNLVPPDNNLYESNSLLSSTVTSSCCNPDEWSLSHSTVVSEFARCLRAQYQSNDILKNIKNINAAWSESIIKLTGKSSTELNIICILKSNELSKDIRSGLITTTDLGKHNFFEWQSSKILQSFVSTTDKEQISNTNLPNLGNYGQILDIKYNSNSTKTVRRSKKRVIVDADGIKVTGFHNIKHWQNGKLIYEEEQPIDNDSAWELEEIEHPSLLKRNLFLNKLKEHNLVISDLIKWWQNDSLELYNFAQQNQFLIYDIIYWLEKEIEEKNLKITKVNKDQSKWQVTVTKILEKVIEEPCESVEDLQQRLTEHRHELLEISEKYYLSKQTINSWIRKELDRFYASGELKIDNFTPWKAAVERHLSALLNTKNHWTLEEFKSVLKEDSDFFQIVINHFNKTEADINNFLEEKLTQLEHLGGLSDENIKIFQKGVFLSPYIPGHEFKTAETKFGTKLREQLIKQHLDAINDGSEYIKQVLENVKENLYENYFKELESNTTQQLNIIKSQFLRNIFEWNTEVNGIDGISENDFQLKALKRIIRNNKDELSSLSTTMKEKVHDLENILAKEIEKNLQLINEVKNELVLKEETTFKVARETGSDIHDNEFQIELYRTKLNSVYEVYKLKIYQIQQLLNRQLASLNAKYIEKIEKVVNIAEQSEHKTEFFISNHNLEIEQFEKTFKSIAKEIENLTNELNDHISSIIKEINALKAHYLTELQRELNDYNQLHLSLVADIKNYRELSLEQLQKNIQIDQNYINQYKEYVVSLTEFNKQTIEAKLSDKWLEIEQFYTNSANKVRSFKNKYQSTRIHISNSLEEYIQELSNDSDNINKFYQFIESSNQNLLRTLEEYNYQIQEVNQNYRLDALIKVEGEMNEITKVLDEERQNIETFIKNSHGLVISIDQYIEENRPTLELTANKYNFSVTALEKWHRHEYARLYNKGQLQYIVEYLKKVVIHNHFTLEQFESEIINKQEVLQHLSQTYSLKVNEVHELLVNAVDVLQNEGVFSKEKREAIEWQRVERERLHQIIRTKGISGNLLRLQSKVNDIHYQLLAIKYNIKVTEIEEWLKYEIDNLEFLGELKIEKVEEWQKYVLNYIDVLVTYNDLTIEQVEQQLSETINYLLNNIQMEATVIEEWLRSQFTQLQTVGLLHKWQKTLRETIIDLIKKHNDSTEELKKKLTTLINTSEFASQYQIPIAEVENWISNELDMWQTEGILGCEALQKWQVEWLNSLTQLIKRHEFTINEFEVWLEEDYGKLQNLATEHHYDINKLVKWIKSVRQRIIFFKLREGNVRLTKWQEVVANYLNDIKEETYPSIDELEQKLKLFYGEINILANKYQTSAKDIYNWLRKRLTKLFATGQLRINNLVAWQVAAVERLNTLFKWNTHWTVETIHNVLDKNSDELKELAFLYHTPVQDIRNLINYEVNVLTDGGKLSIEKISQWQDQYRLIFKLVQHHYNNATEELEGTRKDSYIKEYFHTVNLVNENVNRFVNSFKNNTLLQYLQKWLTSQLSPLKEEQRQLAMHNSVLQRNLGVLIENFEKNLENLTIDIDNRHNILQNINQQYNSLLNHTIANFRATIEKWERNGPFSSTVKFIRELELKIENGNDNPEINDLKLIVDTLYEMLRKEIKKFTKKASNIRKWGEAELNKLLRQKLITAEELQQWIIDRELEFENFKQRKQVLFENYKNSLEENFKQLESSLKSCEIRADELESYTLKKAAEIQESTLGRIERLSQLNDWQGQQLELLVYLVKNSNHLSLSNLQGYISKYYIFVTSYVTNIDYIDKNVAVKVKEQQDVIAAQLVHLNSSLETIASATTHENDNLNLLRSNVKTDLVTFSERHNSSVTKYKSSTLFELGKVTDLQEIIDKEILRLNAWLNRRFSSADKVLNQIPELTKSQRTHLENIFKEHKGLVFDIDQYIAQNHLNSQNLSDIYSLNVEHFEQWQRRELEYLQKTTQLQNLYEHLKKIVIHNHFTLEQFESEIINKQEVLQHLSQTYSLKVNEVHELLVNAVDVLQNEHIFIEEKTEVVEWQRLERERLHQIIRTEGINGYLLQLETRVNKIYFEQFAAKYNIKVSEIEAWLKEEIDYLEFTGQVKAEKVEKWQKDITEKVVSFYYKTSSTINLEQQVLSNLKALNLITNNAVTTTWVKRVSQSISLLEQATKPTIIKEFIPFEKSDDQTYNHRDQSAIDHFDEQSTQMGNNNDQEQQSVVDHFDQQSTQTSDNNDQEQKSSIDHFDEQSTSDNNDQEQQSSIDHFDEQSTSDNNDQEQQSSIDHFDEQSTQTSDNNDQEQQSSIDHFDQQYTQTSDNNDQEQQSSIDHFDQQYTQTSDNNDQEQQSSIDHFDQQSTQTGNNNDLEQQSSIDHFDEQSTSDNNDQEQQSVIDHFDQQYIQTRDNNDQEQQSVIDHFGQQYIQTGDNNDQEQQSSIDHFDQQYIQTADNNDQEQQSSIDHFDQQYIQTGDNNDLEQQSVIDHFDQQYIQTGDNNDQEQQSVIDHFGQQYIQTGDNNDQEQQSSIDHFDQQYIQTGDNNDHEQQSVIDQYDQERSLSDGHRDQANQYTHIEHISK